MTFLANENFSVASLRNLRDKGFEVESASELFAGSADEKVLEHAHLHKETILTFDRDYGQLIFEKKMPLPACLVYFRFVPQSPKEAVELFLKMIIDSKTELNGWFIVLYTNTIRKRKLA